MLVDNLPAWTSDRLSRLVKAPKRHFVDPGLAVAAIRLDAAGLLRDTNLVGRIIESFVVAQLRPLLATAETRPRLHHLRTGGGEREIDLIIEYGGNRVVAVEVKATSAPKARDARHLEWLRETLGDRFIGGVLLHTGSAQAEISPHVVALPINALWE